MTNSFVVVASMVAGWIVSLPLGAQTIVANYDAGVAAGTIGAAADPVSQGWTYQMVNLTGGGIYAYDSSTKPESSAFALACKGGWTTADGTGYGYGYYRYGLDAATQSEMAAGWTLDVTFSLDSSWYVPTDGSVGENYFKSVTSGGSGGSIEGTRIAVSTANGKYMIIMMKSDGNTLWIYDGTESWGMNVGAFDAFHQLSLVYDGQNVSLKFGSNPVRTLNPISQIQIWDRSGETPTYENDCIFFGQASVVTTGSATWNKVKLTTGIPSIADYDAGVATGTIGAAADPTSQGWAYQTINLNGGIYAYDSSAKPVSSAFSQACKGGWTTADGAGYGYGYYRYGLDTETQSEMAAGWTLDVTFALDSSWYDPTDGSVGENYFKSAASGGSGGSIEGTRIAVVTQSYKYLIIMTRTDGNTLWVYDGAQSWNMNVPAFEGFHNLSLKYNGQNAILYYGDTQHTVTPITEVQIWDRNGETPSYESDCIFFGEASAATTGSATWNKVTLTKTTNPVVVTSQNMAFTVPAISAITTDGDLSDWSKSTDWSDEFIYWYGTGLTSITQTKFAWNNAGDTLYVSFRTNQTNGGHPVVGLSSNIDATVESTTGDATQLAFDIVNGNVVVMNEIEQYCGYGHLTTGVVAAAVLGQDGYYTYEIAIPVWTNWVTPGTKQNLTEGSKLYVYAMMQDVYNGAGGTDMTYYGNPAFSGPGGFHYASTLTLTAIPGDANGDNMVDVGDLGILAANYGGSGKTWTQGDFNGDGLVDVGDLGILAANYGTGANASVDFSTDYAKAFGTTVAEDGSDEVMSSPICSGLGLPLMAGLFLAGLLLGVTKQEA